MALKKNKIYQGDCIESLKKLKKGSVDLVFADPPFNIGYEYDVYDDAQEAEEYLKWSKKWMKKVYRALKEDGTFWLAIGDEYAAELKIEAQKLGFHCRSWVIWYYTFGVNCVNGFSRSHTHIFHFVKDKKKFTFNRFNPQVRVKSARQLVYADNRANPLGRLPDNTWITRPQDAPESFSPSHDTWYFARVAGTFKEREGFHGCQMPEQLLARIIRASSHPQDLVVDPFGGSGTTLCVAKKLGRQYIGFELSEDYSAYIEQRLAKTSVGDELDGAEDPISSSPATKDGKRRKKPFDEKTEKAVIKAYQSAGEGYPADYILCDQELNKAFIKAAKGHGIGGTAMVWNQFLLSLRKAGKLPKSKKKPTPLSANEMEPYAYAAEVAWRMLAMDYRQTLDSILCSPEFAVEFDRLATAYGPQDVKVSSLNYRRAALSIRKRSNAARTGSEKYSEWFEKSRKLDRISLEEYLSGDDEIVGVYVICSGEIGVYVGETNNIRAQVQQIASNPNWQNLEIDSLIIIPNSNSRADRYTLKSAIVRREIPLLNCQLLVHASEFPKAHSTAQ